MIPEVVMSSSNKRKWDCNEKGEDNFNSVSKAENTASMSFFDLQRPIPLDWKQCLDIQSGEIHYYESKTQKRSCRDPRGSPDKLSNSEGGHGHHSRPLSLDLELNLLPSDSVKKDNLPKEDEPDSHLSLNSISNNGTATTNNELMERSCNSSWTSFEDDHKEMVAAVCTRCHMLVILCKSSPACPNCKFIYHPNQSPMNLFSQLVGKD